MSRAVVLAAVAVVGWTYVGFPLALLVRAWLRPRPHAAADITPSVAVVVAAHDEERAIVGKLASVTSQDYPPDRLEIVVASDGSTDATERLVEQVASTDGRVRLLALPRVGKATALNEAVAATHGAIVVFTDANSVLDPGAVRALVRPFADLEVGAVAGDQRYTDDGPDAAVGDAERRYWDLDRVLKVAGSRAGNATSATGALYAIRRELIDTVPDGVTDDFFLSTGAIVRGRRLVFAADAVTREPVASSAGAEFARKVRVMSRGFRAVRVRRSLLSLRRHGFYALQLFTHKILRRLVVIPLAVVAVASLIGAPADPLLRWLVAGQVGFYGLAALGGLLVAAGRRPPPPVRLATYFCLVNAAAGLALWRTLRGRTPALWQPERDVPTGAADLTVPGS